MLKFATMDTSIYDIEYARNYFRKVVKSSYFLYKNHLICELIKRLGIKNIVDIGCNINAVVKDGSLRAQLEDINVGYFGIDLDEHFIVPEHAKQIADEIPIYETQSGIIGDMECIPLADRSIECITCLDVIEHTDNPNKVLKEFHRVLKPNAKLLIVVPSLYKLDFLNLDSIAQKRKSSHLTKGNSIKWIEYIESNGFHIRHDLSRPFGILSGLSYLMWLDCQNVPMRNCPTGEEVLCDGALRHKAMKKIFDHNAIATDPVVYEVLNKRIGESLFDDKMSIFDDFLYVIRQKLVSKSFVDIESINETIAELLFLRNSLIKLYRPNKDIFDCLNSSGIKSIGNSLLLVAERK